MPKEYTLIGGNGTQISPLEVTEDGTYKAGDSRAFNPVIVRTGGGGSGGGVLIVTYTLTGTSTADGGTATCDHTLAQILSAVDGGMYVVAKIIGADGDDYLPLQLRYRDDGGELMPDVWFEANSFNAFDDSLLLTGIYIDHFEEDNVEMIEFKKYSYFYAMQLK